MFLLKELQRNSTIFLAIVSMFSYIKQILIAHTKQLHTICVRYKKAQIKTLKRLFLPTGVLP